MRNEFGWLENLIYSIVTLRLVLDIADLLTFFRSVAPAWWSISAPITLLVPPSVRDRECCVLAKFYCTCLDFLRFWAI